MDTCPNCQFDPNKDPVINWIPRLRNCMCCQLDIVSRGKWAPNPRGWHVFQRMVEIYGLDSILRLLATINISKESLIDGK